MSSDPETMCLTRLCGELGARMSHLAQLPFGPKVKGVRRIQGRPDVFRTDNGRVVVMQATKGVAFRAMPCDARDYLRLLRDGYVSTLPHWHDVMFQLSKQPPALIVEMWVLRREEEPIFDFIQELAAVEVMAANYMSQAGVVGWWLDYCFNTEVVS